MGVLRGANDALAFLLELAAVAALVAWGFTVGSSMLLRIVLGIGAPVLLIVIWGLWLAPRAPHPLPRPAVFAGKLAILLVAAAALWAAGHPLLGATLGLLAVINLGLWWAIGSTAEPARSRG